MKNITTSFKEEIKTFGKQQDVQIIYGENVITSENLNSINLYYKGDLLKSVMKGLNIDSNINIPTDTELSLKYGLLVNGEYEYINYGNFIVYESEKQEDTNSYLLTCYDKLLYSMKNYEAMDITYPITVENYLKGICRHLGLEYQEKEIANGKRVILNELYLSDGDSLDYTFRDVLDELSQVTAGTICINKDNKLEVRYVNDTNDTINEEYLKDINVNFGEKYGKINGVVLSRSAGADNVYLVDDASVKENGLCEIKISDNQIMNFNDRSDYLPEILAKVNGIEYFVNDFSSTGIMYYDLLDSYNVQIGDKTYKCLMLNDEINITQGLEELVYTEMPEVSETDYTKADKTDRRIKQAYIIADKVNQKIQALVSDLNEAGYGSFSELVQDIEGIKTNVGFIADLTVTKSGINPITLEECLAGELQYLSIKANNSIFNPLFPRPDLYPSPTLYPRGKTYIYIINQKVDENDVIVETTKTIDLHLAQGIRMYNTEIYDEIVYEAIVEEGKTKGKIIRRVGVLEDGTLYPLGVPYEEPIYMEDITLEEGTNIITFNEGHIGNVTATYVKKNEFTSIFATAYEVNSYITQLADEIDLMVKEKVGKNEVIADLNIAVKEGQGIIELIGNVLKIQMDNFKLTEEGDMTANSGTIANWEITEEFLRKGLAGIKGIDDTESDEDVFYAGEGLGYQGNPAFHVTNKGNTYVKSLNIKGKNSSDIGQISIYNDKNQVGTTITDNTVNSYYLTASNGSSTPTKGKCLHGYDMGHDYRCHWQDSKLSFIVDDMNIGYVTVSTSDARLKKDIIDIPQELLYAIEEVELKQFKLITGNDKYKFGIIAQDLVNAFKKYNLDYKQYEIISEVQLDLTDETLYFTIDYEQVLILKNQLLEDRIKALENKVDRILNKLEEE